MGLKDEARRILHHNKKQEEAADKEQKAQAARMAKIHPYRLKVNDALANLILDFVETAVDLEVLPFSCVEAQFTRYSDAVNYVGKVEKFMAWPLEEASVWLAVTDDFGLIVCDRVVVNKTRTPPSGGLDSQYYFKGSRTSKVIMIGRISEPGRILSPESRFSFKTYDSGPSEREITVKSKTIEEIFLSTVVDMMQEAQKSPRKKR